MSKKHFFFCKKKSFLAANFGKTKFGDFFVQLFNFNFSCKKSKNVKKSTKNYQKKVIFSCKFWKKQVRGFLKKSFFAPNFWKNTKNQHFFCTFFWQNFSCLSWESVTGLLGHPLIRKITHLKLFIFRCEGALSTHTVNTGTGKWK